MIAATFHKTFSAFAGNKSIAVGDLSSVAMKAKRTADRSKNVSILVFDDTTGRTVEIDFRGTMKDVGSRYAATAESIDESADAPRGPGRPKLGVVAREITLLPRHWEWLASQPGGASVALRRLVEDARKRNTGKDRIRQSQEAAYRFMSTMAGNLPGFEEATRALFAGNEERFDDLTRRWPSDVAKYARRLAEAALTGGTP
jgi:hypothetical protein